MAAWGTHPSVWGDCRTEGQLKMRGCTRWSYVRCPYIVVNQNSRESLGARFQSCSTLCNGSMGDPSKCLGRLSDRGPVEDAGVHQVVLCPLPVHSGEPKFSRKSGCQISELFDPM